MPNELKITGKGNRCEVAEEIMLTGTIIGDDNEITAPSTKGKPRLHIDITGSGNRIKIGRYATLNALTIKVGSTLPAYRTTLTIGERFSSASQCRFLLPNSGNRIEIGSHAMFSNSIVLRGGELPHLIFDLETGAYLDVSDGIFLGDRVWVGEKAYINKSVSIANDSIVGAYSVVTKRFAEPNVVIAGNPAKVVRRNVKWVPNPKMLEEGSIYQQSYRDHFADYGHE